MQKLTKLKVPTTTKSNKNAFWEQKLENPQSKTTSNGKTKQQCQKRRKLVKKNANKLTIKLNPENQQNPYQLSAK